MLGMSEFQRAVAALERIEKSLASITKSLETFVALAEKVVIEDHPISTWNAGGHSGQSG